MYGICVSETDEELRKRIEGLAELREFVEARTKIAYGKWKTAEELLADKHPMQTGVGANRTWLDKVTATKVRGG